MVPTCTGRILRAPGSSWPVSRASAQQSTTTCVVDVRRCHPTTSGHRTHKLECECANTMGRNKTISSFPRHILGSFTYWYIPVGAPILVSKSNHRNYFPGHPTNGQFSQTGASSCLLWLRTILPESSWAGDSKSVEKSGDTTREPVPEFFAPRCLLIGALF